MLAHVHHDPELLLKAQRVAVVFFDVDGVLTDGGLYFSSRGETIKRFHTLDGYGFKMLSSAGIIPVIITGRDSRPLRLRLESLGVEHAHYGVADKSAAAITTLKGMDLTWSDAAVMGDDWPDLPLILRCAFSAAPRNAHEEVIARVDYVSRRTGGHGAVRDLCDLLLIARGRYTELLKEAGA